MAKKTEVLPADYVALPSSDSPEVVHAKDLAGNDIYAWRKDGQKPVIDMTEFTTNRHSALRPKNTADGLAADFADHVGPQ